MPAANWQLFARAEWIETQELGEDHHHLHEVGKLSAGLLRSFEDTERIRLGHGALYTVNEVDRKLRPSYGGGNPNGAMVFLQFFAGT